MALQIEFFHDPQETVRTILEGFQIRLHTAFPGIIVSFDPVKVTAVVQPAIQALLRSEQGALTYVTLPQLLDCPVIFPRGGGNGGAGFTLTFPVVAGDECLVILSERAIDNWWAQSGVQQPAEIRYHDLSDGFALPGPFSQPNIPTAPIDPDNVMLTKNDGSTYIQITPAGAMTMLAPGGVKIIGTLEVTDATKLDTTLEVVGDAQLDAMLTVEGAAALEDGVTVTGAATGAGGDLMITGAVVATGEVTGNGVALSTHTHSGVTTGSGDTGPPV